MAWGLPRRAARRKPNAVQLSKILTIWPRCFFGWGKGGVPGFLFGHACRPAFFSLLYRRGRLGGSRSRAISRRSPASQPRFIDRKSTRLNSSHRH